MAAQRKNLEHNKQPISYIVVLPTDPCLYLVDLLEVDITELVSFAEEQESSEY